MCYGRPSGQAEALTAVVMRYLKVTLLSQSSVHRQTVYTLLLGNQEYEVNYTKRIIFLLNTTTAANWKVLPAN